jgi:hypothetical protein
MKKTDKIVIDGVMFDAMIGARVLKLKYDELPDKFQVSMGKIWHKIKPYTFKEIATGITDIEQKRKAIQLLGIDGILKDVESKLLATESINKKAHWVNAQGELETVQYEDVYELYSVKGGELHGGPHMVKSGANQPLDAHYIKCKDTSTGKAYLIWVDLIRVASTNGIKADEVENWVAKINPIMAIAWTITTNVAEGSIQKIFRQGDCILIKKKRAAKFVDRNRHLTEKEYRSLLVNES